MADLKLLSAAGGSVTLECSDALTTDEVVGAGLYKSPDGSLWKLTVDNSGNITMVKVQ